jgi:hypothetical protein
VVGSNLLHTLFFFQVLGHGVNGQVSFPGRQRHTFKPPAGFNQIGHRLTFAGDDQPASALAGKFGRKVDTLLSETRFHKIPGGDEISDEPAFETTDPHSRHGQAAAVALGILVAESKPANQLLLGAIAVNLNAKIFSWKGFAAMISISA